MHCFEFKWETLSVDNVIAQLNASAAWCRTLCNAIKNYTNKSKRVYLRKYVLTRHPNPDPYLDANNKSLNSEQAIRHYHYDEIDGMRIEDRENATEEVIS